MLAVVTKFFSLLKEIVLKRAADLAEALFLPRTPNQIHGPQFNPAGGLQNPKSPSIMTNGSHHMMMGAQHLAMSAVPPETMTSAGNFVTIASNPQGNQPILPFGTNGTPASQQPAGVTSPATDINNNSLNATSSTNSSTASSRIITSVTFAPSAAGLGVNGPTHGSNTSQVSINGSETGAPMSMMTMASMANSMNGFPGGLSSIALHNMTVPSSPGFLNGSPSMYSGKHNIDICLGSSGWVKAAGLG